jgi:ATP/maltotriose-dependent transcriptional regulator MalT
LPCYHAFLQASGLVRPRPDTTTSHTLTTSVDACRDRTWADVAGSAPVGFGRCGNLRDDRSAATSGLRMERVRLPEGDSVAPCAGPDPAGPADERVERPSVDELLDRAAKRRICVVIGAAGWGKTTAVAAWSRNRPTAWLRYEHPEDDAERLLAGLLRALRAHVPAPTQDMAAGDGAGDAERVGSSVAAICAWLHSALTKELILVLDDLHGLQPDSDAAGIVESLCQRAPELLRLVLISRRDLPFSLQRLRGRGLVTEIHAPDLAFEVADVEALLRKTVGKEPPGLSRRVWEHTGGWAAAVHRAVEMVRVVGVDQRLTAVEQLSHPGQRFHSYLAEEVIGAAPEWVQQLLRTLAIFGEVRCTTRIARGRTVNDMMALFAELSRQGLVRRAGEGTGWALVRPLGDYFEHEAALPASERKALHVMAANECLGRGAPADALRHLLAAGDHAGCASLLIDHGGAMVARGQLDTVLQAAELPAEYLDDPRIHLVLGQARQVRGQWAQALWHFQRAGYGQDELDPALAWRVGLIAFVQGEFTEVHALIRRTRFDREDTLNETRVLALSASAYRMIGDIAGLRKVAGRAPTPTAPMPCAAPRRATTSSK